MKQLSRFRFPIAGGLGVLLIVAFFAQFHWEILDLMILLGVILGGLLMRSRPRVGRIVMGLIAIPSVLFLVYVLAERPVWDVGHVIWDVSEAGGRSARCTDILPPVSGSPLTEQSDTTQAMITPQRATEIGEAVIFHDDPSGFLFTTIFGYRDGPRLVTTTFPDRTTRLAWYMVQTSSITTPIEGTSTNLYVDAQSGSPLMLLHDVHVPSDVQFDCGRTNVSNAGKLLPSVLLQIETWQFVLIGYLLGLLLITGVYFGLQTIRAWWKIRLNSSTEAKRNS